jgi:hypothetical protein
MGTDYDAQLASYESQSITGTNKQYYMHGLIIDANGIITDGYVTNGQPSYVKVAFIQGSAYDSAGASIPLVSDGKTAFTGARGSGPSVYFGTGPWIPVDPSKVVASVILRAVGQPIQGGGQVLLAFWGFPLVTGAVPAQIVKCFLAGAPILTPSGYRAVEMLRTGDQVKTAAGHVVPIKVFTSTVLATEDTAPYFIPAKACGDFPVADMQLSPRHMFTIGRGRWLKPCVAAALYPSIKQYALGEIITYYHLECPDYFRDNLVYNGTVVESFGNGKGLFKDVYTWIERKQAFMRRSPTLHVGRS